MSEPIGVIPRTDAADTEIELSAQDLLALSDSRRSDPREPGQTLQTKGSETSSRNPGAPKASRNVRAPHLAVSLIVTSALVGTGYVLSTPDRATPSTTDTSQQTIPSDPPAQQQVAAGEPVRFINPFDANEVFEFPPGTTETEAREAVAALLTDRAISRQRS